MSPLIQSALKSVAIQNVGTRGRFKLAAAIIHRKRIISFGVNSYKSHPMMSQFSKNSHAIFLHAEVDAIRNALRTISADELTGCDLCVVRVKRPGMNSRDWVFGNAAPCQGCIRAIETFGLRAVYFTDEDGKMCELPGL